MSSFVIPSFYWLTGIMVYAAVYHFAVGIRPPRHHIHILFAGLCLTMVPYAYFVAQTLQATDIDDFVRNLKGNLAAVCVFFALFPWFIALYTDRRPLPLLAGLSLLFTVLFTVNLMMPYSLQFDHVDGLHTLRLPWGETIVHARGHHSRWLDVGVAGVATIFSYALYAIGSQYHRHRQGSDLAILLVIVLLCITSAQGILVRLGFVDFVEIGPFGFVALVLGMGVALGYETQRRLRTSERHFRSLFENSPTGMVAFDPAEGHIVQANPVALDMSGYSAEEILTKTMADLTVPEDMEEATERFALLAGGSVDHMHYERRYRRKDGSSFVADNSISTLKDETGKVVRFIVSGTDITERKQAEVALKESEIRFRTIIEQSPIGISFSRDGYVVDMNDAMLRMFGYDDVAELRGQSVLIRFAPQCQAEIEERIKRRARNEQIEDAYESTGLRKDGSQFPIFITVKRIVLSDGPLTIAFTIDFSERREAEERIRYLAYYDHLTDLPNRQLLSERLEQALASSARSGRHGALLFIDMDNFMALNDTLGHEIGDLLLKQVGERLVSCVGEGGTVARFGGDEFVVMLEYMGEDAFEATSQTKTIGMRMLATLSQPYQLDTHEYRCTNSIGAVLFNGDEQTVEKLLRQADIAMYQAKQAGRNTLRFFDPKMQDAISIRVALESDLRKALEGAQFHLNYQIQVDDKHHPLGAEVLIRWMHPERGFVSPAHFIPLAEETGLILPIGQWVLESACAQLAAWWQDPLTHDLVLAVNVSSRQFHEANFADQIRAVVKRHAIDPKQLKLELTETILLERIDDTIAIMKALKEIGVQLSLDDFGTGYSSLQYLKLLPLDQLKIDQSFVRDLASDNDDMAIVSTIIAMAHNLNLDVIAEGVETQEQRQFLSDKGCKHYQGYLFGKPVPIEQFGALLGEIG